LVDSDKVYLNIGGTGGAGIVALAAPRANSSGKPPTMKRAIRHPPATINGKPEIVFFTRSGWSRQILSRGASIWNFLAVAHARLANAARPWSSGTKSSFPQATKPVVSSLRVAGKKAQKIWSSDEALSSHYATSVYHDGFLYGYHGRQDVGRPALRCIEWATGKLRWSEEEFGAGTVTLAGDRLLLMHEDGRLLVAEASPDRFRLLREAQILPNGVRAHPALADGLLAQQTSSPALICERITGKSVSAQAQLQRKPTVSPGPRRVRMLGACCFVAEQCCYFRWPPFSLCQQPGALDLSFTPPALDNQYGGIYLIIPLSDGRFSLAETGFLNENTVRPHRVARLNSDGVLMLLSP
jgi:hypothetical protein